MNQHISDGQLTQEVVLHSNNLLNKTTLFLGRQTKGGIKASVVLIFEVYETKIAGPDVANMVNMAPRFN